ncbi:MAG TPA: GIY-YIG nuclease family protein [bacterium]|nr:GIY-YIG nuclease family protein [bacterium]
MKYEKYYFVYIMASRSGVLYVGFTNDIFRRVLEHKSGKISGFTQKYKCKKLVYFESDNDVYAMIEREKQIKRWRREKKISLIRKENPKWKDLYEEIKNLYV